jgi:hypothetical protein
MENNFKPGDIVRIKSDERLVLTISTTDASWCNCVFVSKEGKIEHVKLPQAVLVKAGI